VVELTLKAALHTGRLLCYNGGEAAQGHDMNKSELQSLMKQKFLNEEKFAEFVEMEVSQRDSTYLDAIMLFCEEFEFPIEFVPKVINRQIKEQLEYEVTSLHRLKSKPSFSLFD